MLQIIKSIFFLKVVSWKYGSTQWSLSPQQAVKKYHVITGNMVRAYVLGSHTGEVDLSYENPNDVYEAVGSKQISTQCLLHVKSLDSGTSSDVRVIAAKNNKGDRVKTVVYALGRTIYKLESNDKWFTSEILIDPNDLELSPRLALQLTENNSDDIDTAAVERAAELWLGNKINLPTQFLSTSDPMLDEDQTYTS
jgi:hypothetical protein